MPRHNAFMERLGLEHPIIQAPMAGGGDTPELVASVAEAGALGMIGATYLTPKRMHATLEAVRKATNRAFGVNLFAPAPVATPPGNSRDWVARMAPYHVELGLDAPALPDQMVDPFETLFPIALESGASVFSVTSGPLSAEAVAAAQARDMVVMATATTVEEAVILDRVKVDAIVAQGAEAGGHRGGFPEDGASAMVGTIALVPQMVDAVSVPVVASGGIMDGRGIAAALALGASAVQMGTAFLTCEEAGVCEAYKAAVLGAHETDSVVTEAFSGRPARGVRNRFIAEMANVEPLPFPYQNSLTRPMRAAASAQENADYLSLWAGQGVRLARRKSGRDLVRALANELAATIDDLSSGQ